MADDSDEVARLADEIVGVAGEFPPFEDTHGFSIDGVDLPAVLVSVERDVRLRSGGRDPHPGGD